MAKLPLRIQVGIRDSWNAPSSPLQKAIASLKSTLGIAHVNVNPEWSLLLSELEKYYPDKATFVPSIAGVVEAFCAVLAALVEEEDDDGQNAKAGNNKGGEDEEEGMGFGDRLLDEINGVVRIYVEVSNDRELTLEWSAQQKGFTIKLAKAPCPSRSYVESLFRDALSSSNPSFFSPANKKTPTPTTATTTTTPASSSYSNINNPASPTGEGDDWADIHVSNDGATTVEVPTPTPLPHRPKLTPQPQRRKYDIIPDLATVPRPDDLLQRPPYHLHVSAYGSNGSQVDVECSHSPTLQFLAEYLQKWCRTNHQRTDNPPLAQITLHQSAFGLGLVYDRLTLTTEQRYSLQSLTPTTVLALVEGVLEYELVAAHASSWAFRRDVEFRSGR
ncbi:hypothetical protein F5Y17DRAFT_454557 [Xylariaceae sp. FL0594]|nr:hypothetical protein F5Y17DRAFT_454557 [Xylariaceae sp. FL0594]